MRTAVRKPKSPLQAPALSTIATPQHVAQRHVPEPGAGHDFAEVRTFPETTVESPPAQHGRQLIASQLSRAAQQSRPNLMTGGPMLQRQVPTASQEPAPVAETPGTVPSTGAKDEEAASENSPIRQELLRLFTVFDKQVVGDEHFDRVIKETEWNDIKEKERVATEKYDAAKKKYTEELEKFKSGKRATRPTMPIPVAKFTTCIATEARLLQDAFKNLGLTIRPAGKKARFDFATEGQKNAEKIGPDVWHTASPGMTERPKPADIFVFAKRGDKVDKAARELNYINSVSASNIAKKTESSEKAEAALEAAEAAHAKAQAAIADLEGAETSHTSSAYMKANMALAGAVIALNAAKKKATNAAEALKKAEDEVPAYTKKLEDARKLANHAKFFEFSHVGFLQSIDPKLNDDGTENWLTFDGGQTVQSRGAKQGSESVRRKYDPRTNEISGEKSQGGDGRWLQGWVDVDKLVAQASE